MASFKNLNYLVNFIIKVMKDITLWQNIIDQNFENIIINIWNFNISISQIIHDSPIKKSKCLNLVRLLIICEWPEVSLKSLNCFSFFLLHEEVMWFIPFICSFQSNMNIIVSSKWTLKQWLVTFIECFIFTS